MRDLPKLRDSASGMQLGKRISEKTTRSNTFLFYLTDAPPWEKNNQFGSSASSEKTDADVPIGTVFESVCMGRMVHLKSVSRGGLRGVGAPSMRFRLRVMLRGY